MFPTLIEIFGLKISTYGVLVAIGLLTAYILVLKLSEREGLDTKKVDNLFIITVLSGILGARIAFSVENWEQLGSLWEVFAIWKGGVSFYGGLIGGIIGAFIGIKLFKLPVWKVGDVAAPSLAIAHAIGRLGCTAAGCCYGRPVADVSSNSVGIHFMDRFPFFYIVFPQGGTAPYGVPLYPTQLMEFVGNLLIFTILILVYRRKRVDGEVFALYMLLYGTERFLLEFYRGVTPPLPGIGLTWNQVVSLILILASITLFLLLRRIPARAV
jgi:phosphatidylglycerol:prolipoprotein diacylglycerol transferase